MRRRPPHATLLAACHGLLVGLMADGMSVWLPGCGWHGQVIGYALSHPWKQWQSTRCVRGGDTWHAAAAADVVPALDARSPYSAIRHHRNASLSLLLVVVWWSGWMRCWGPFPRTPTPTTCTTSPCCPRPGGRKWLVSHPHVACTASEAVMCRSTCLGMRSFEEEWCPGACGRHRQASMACKYTRQRPQSFSQPCSAISAAHIAG